MRLVAVLVAVAIPASSQTAEGILKQVAGKYRSLKSYRLEAQVVTEPGALAMTLTVAARPPALRRIETSGVPSAAALRVYDGRTVWDFRAAPNQFARADQATYDSPFEVLNLLHDPVDTYYTLNEAAAGARLLREETIQAAGAQRSCWVVDVSPKSAGGGGMMERTKTYWIEKSTYLVLKESQTTNIQPLSGGAGRTQTVTVTYTEARVNEPIAEDFFHFEPPHGAMEVAEFRRPVGPGQPLPHTAAPDFVLQDLDGKEVAWNSFKGKPVLVSFWATWCQPCRAEMPKVEEARRLFGEKGLEVLAINFGETPEVARKFIAENGYAFHVLLDRDKALSGKFSVGSIPALLLINRDGYLSARFDGFSSALDLKEELKKIGVQ
jgi:outer membrane lipoprotein-sorting protein/peroxiredoxin